MMTRNKSIDARRLLESYLGKTLKTFTGRPNTIVRLEDDFVVVATKRSPAGERVPIEWVQEALNRISAESEVEISVPSLGHRSSFCGAVLLSLPGVVAKPYPQRAVVQDRPQLNDL